MELTESSDFAVLIDCRFQFASSLLLLCGGLPLSTSQRLTASVWRLAAFVMPTQVLVWFVASNALDRAANYRFSCCYRVSAFVLSAVYRFRSLSGLPLFVQRTTAFRVASGFPLSFSQRITASV